MTWFFALGALASLTLFVRDSAPPAIDFALLGFVQDLAPGSRQATSETVVAVPALWNQGRWLDVAMIFVSIPGNGFVMTLAGMAAVFVGLRMAGYRRVARIVLLVDLLAVSINMLVYKPLAARLRPTSEAAMLLVEWKDTGLHRHSFPSGHTVHYTVLFGLLAWWASSHVRRNPLRHFLVGVFGSLVLLVGLSRVYLGAHWPTDVLAGYLAGYLWLGIGAAWIRRDSR